MCVCTLRTKKKELTVYLKRSCKNVNFSVCIFSVKNYSSVCVGVIDFAFFRASIILKITYMCPGRCHCCGSQALYFDYAVISRDRTQSDKSVLFLLGILYIFLCCFSIYLYIVLNLG